MSKLCFNSFNTDTLHRTQGLFASIFILQNRMQTAGDKIQTKISMKQWLLLAMVESCPTAPSLTNLGRLMGCSHQNIKKLASALEKQGFVCLSPSDKNGIVKKSLVTELTEKLEQEIFKQLGGSYCKNIYDTV